MYQTLRAWYIAPADSRTISSARYIKRLDIDLTASQPAHYIYNQILNRTLRDCHPNLETTFIFNSFFRDNSCLSCSK